MFLSAAIPGPQPGSLLFAHGSTGAGANVGPGPQAGRGGLQKVALWSFTALASARACTKEQRNRVRKCYTEEQTLNNLPLLLKTLWKPALLLHPDRGEQMTRSQCASPLA